MHVTIHWPQTNIADTWGLQGTGDNFYKQGQLLPENFLKAAHDAGYDDGVQVRVRSQADYDHSYYFVRASSLTHHSLTRPSTDLDFCGRPHPL